MIKNVLRLIRRILVATLLTFGTHFTMFVICWMFRDELAGVIPYATLRLIALPASVPTQIQLYGSLNIALSGALLLSSPFITGAWLFSLSGGRSRRFQIAFVLSCMALAASGAAFGYYVALPLAGEIAAWSRATGLFRGENLHELALQTVAGLGIGFQMPALIYALQVRTPSGT